MSTKSNKYFIDSVGVIYTLYPDGTSNNPNKVSHLKGEHFISILDDDNFVIDEYFLWDSIGMISKELEKIMK